MVLLIVLSASLVAAAVEDVIRLRISNITVVVVLVSAIAAALLKGPEASAWENVVVFVALLVVGTAMFGAGLLGGGDVKLFAAVGLWADFERAVILVAAILLFGGIVAIAVLSSRLLFRRADGATLKARSKQIPYGVAIALGALFTIALQQEIAAAKHPNPLEWHSLGRVVGR
jgi:prepilin peptidase CpaA